MGLLLLFQIFPVINWKLLNKFCVGIRRPNRPVVVCNVTYRDLHGRSACYCGGTFFFSQVFAMRRVRGENIVSCYRGIQAVPLLWRWRK